jgi:hypothetical protein
MLGESDWVPKTFIPVDPVCDSPLPFSYVCFPLSVVRAIDGSQYTYKHAPPTTTTNNTNYVMIIVLITLLMTIIFLPTPLVRMSDYSFLSGVAGRGSLSHYAHEPSLEFYIVPSLYVR